MSARVFECLLENLKNHTKFSTLYFARLGASHHKMLNLSAYLFSTTVSRLAF